MSNDDLPDGVGGTTAGPVTEERRALVAALPPKAGVTATEVQKHSCKLPLHLHFPYLTFAQVATVTEIG